MAQPRYELLVHFLPGVDPVAVAQSLFSNWAKSNRPDLFLFGRSGQGNSVSSDNLREHLTFAEDTEDVAITLRTTRARNNVDQVQFYFTNPTWAYSRPTNFCSVTFFHSKIDDAEPGYSVADLAELLTALTAAGSAKHGNVERSDVMLLPAFQASLRVLSAARREDCLLHWLTWVSHETLSRLGGRGYIEAVGLRVIREEPISGLVLRAGDPRHSDPTLHVKVLNGYMEACGILAPSE